MSGNAKGSDDEHRHISFFVPKDGDRWRSFKLPAANKVLIQYSFKFQADCFFLAPNEIGMIAGVTTESISPLSTEARK